MQEMKERLVQDNHHHMEDMAFKVAAQCFGESLLTWMGVTEKPVRVAPTEIIHLEARKMYEDFNFEMDDGGWYHLEFESDQITLDDLKRFREYEASTSRTYGVSVTTCVLCSANAKTIKSSFTEGLNTYRIKIIRMKNSDADKVFNKIKEKKGLEQEDLIPVLLSPLMGGTMTVKDRILQGIYLVQNGEKYLSKDESNKMEAVMYAFASKFLKDKELKEVEEAILMTELGRMIMEDGMERGMQDKLKEMIQKKLKKGKTIAEIADELEEEATTIQKMIEEMQ